MVTNLINDLFLVTNLVNGLSSAQVYEIFLTKFMGFNIFYCYVTNLVNGLFSISLLF